MRQRVSKKHMNGSSRSESSGKKIGDEDLYKYQFQLGVPGQKESMRKARRAIADWAKVNLSKEIWNLIENNKEATFTEPDDPGKDATPAEMEKFKSEYKDHKEEKKAYKEKKAQAFTIIMMRCHAVMDQKLRSLPEYSVWEEDDDVLSLLMKIRELVNGTDNTRYTFWQMSEATRALYSTKQREKEGLLSFAERFQAQLQVTEEEWGLMVPMIMKDKTDQERVVGRGKFLACLFLSAVDQERYKKTIQALNNDFVNGNISYPEDVPGAVQLLRNRQGDVPVKKRSPDDEPRASTSLNQVNVEDAYYGNPKHKKWICKRCGKRGHIAADCRESVPDSDGGSSGSSSSGSRSGVRGGFSASQVHLPSTCDGYWRS